MSAKENLIAVILNPLIEGQGEVTRVLAFGVDL
jgi:hypothetical protein